MSNAEKMFVIRSCEVLLFPDCGDSEFISWGDRWQLGQQCRIDFDSFSLISLSIQTTPVEAA